MLDRMLLSAGADDNLFVEDVFSTYLYTGNGETQTITNGIDLAGKGGLVWIKGRTNLSSGTPSLHLLTDTNRGAGYTLQSHLTAAQFFNSSIIPSFTSSGFNIGGEGHANGNSIRFASWTFRKAPKFFDVVTYTGNGGSSQTIAHNLGVEPGCIIVKRFSSGSASWPVYHRSLGNTKALYLNLTNAASTWIGHWNNTSPTATNFTVGTDTESNENGIGYVAYLFAHDAGGFGPTGTDGIIQCGSFTTDGAQNASVTLGWEPQWVMVKATNQGYNWEIYDNMRGIGPPGTPHAGLMPNGAGAEFSATGMSINATGFATSNYWGASTAMVYVAIRRGPMRTPTLGTSVFNAQANLTTDANKITTGFVTDWFWERGAYDSPGVSSFQCSQRLTQTALTFSSTAAEGGPYGAPYLMFDYNDGFLSNLSGNINPGLMYGFRRAPGFMDVVCYTGDGNSGRVLNHNLGVVPEMVIVKCRNSTTDGNSSWGAGWWTAVKGSGATGYWFLPSQSSSGLNSSNASGYSAPWSDYFTSATTFRPYYVTVSSGTEGPAGNVSGKTYVAYLFASCPGVSKVGSYTGNGSSQTINCGFTNGARFILIKRTDSAGNWCVWDSARGIVTGDDPVLSLNNNFAQNNTTDDVDPHSTGFIVNSVSPGREINLNGSTYIYLAIA